MRKQRKIEIGQTYDRLTIKEYLGVRQLGDKKLKYYLCECVCGNTIELAGTYIGKVYRSCGCLQKESREKYIPSGTTFGRLTVIERTNETKHDCFLYRCRCSCDGKEILVRSDMLRSGEVQSCGCLHDELLRKNVKNAYKNNFVFATSIPKIKTTKLQSNNTSGITGVSWNSRIHKWQASINFQGKTYNLGYYDDIKLAKDVRDIAKQNLHVEFLKWYEDFKGGRKND